MARTEGQWQKGISLITPSENVPVLLRNTYLNFGGETIGETGYGIRDNSGTMEFKNYSGSWAAFGGGGGYTNLTQFVAQTPWRLFYSNTDGDVAELALGADGTFLKSNGAAVAPSFSTPSGSGDVVGPASAVDSNFASFNTTTGKLIKDSGSKAADFATASHNHTGVYAPVLGTDDNYVTDAEKTKLSNLSGTNTGDQTSIAGITGTKAQFDTAVTDGNFLYVGDVTTNATHTGEVTGSGALTLDKTAITGKTAVTAVGTDYVLISDTSDTGNLKKALASDLIGAGGAVEGTAVLSTGETGGTKYLREDGDGTCSWQAVAGGGNVSKVGTPVDNQVGVWTGDGTIEGDTGLTFDGTTKALTIDAPNTGYPLKVNRTTDTAYGPFIKTKHVTAAPAAGDYIGGVDLYSSDSASNEQEYAYFNAKIISPTSGAEYGSFVIETIRNGVIGSAGKQMLEVGAESDSAINGISVGFDTEAGVVSSRGNQDLTLQTGNTTTGNITIVDGANGQIQLNPNGTGTVKLGTLTGVLRADTGVVSVDTDVTDLVSAASDTAAGKVELAIASEVNTGTDTGRAVTPDALAGSYAGTKTVSVQISGSASGDTALATGDNKATLAIDTTLTGMNLIAVKAYVTTVSSSGAPLFQIRRSRRSSATARTVVDVLSTGVSVDANEFESADATTAAVINTSNDDVQTGDIYLFDCDTAGTGTKGATLLLTFQLP